MAGRTSTQMIEADGISVRLTRKRMRTMTLRVSPEGEVRVSAPYGVSDSEVAAFVRAKRGWIEKARRRALAERAEEDALWQDGSTICLWNEPLTLRFCGAAGGSRKSSVTRRGSELLLQGAALGLAAEPDGAGSAEREALREAGRAAARKAVSHWLAGQLEEALPAVVERAEAEVGVHADGWRLRHMKTRWGSCNVRTRVITLNTELVERDPHCLEGVVIHELCHLVEPSHDARFHALMDEHFPDWRRWRKVLNARPPRHEG